MRRSAIIGLIAVAVILVAGIAYWRWSSAPPGTPPPTVAATPQAPAPAAPDAALPSFDIVRVNPQGQAVIAGRAKPGAEVTVMDGDKELGKVTANQRGEWVLLPQQPLAPGEHQLSLTARDAEGEKKSQGVVAMAVPERAPGQQAQNNESVAVLVPRQGAGAAQALQLPRTHRRLALDVIQYDGAGKVQLFGRADPGARVDAFLDEKAAGESGSAADGVWSMMLRQNVPEGRYRMRLDAHDAQGQKLGELTLTFNRVAPPEGAVAVDIQPGNNLWRIAQHSYGAGELYTEIFQANRTQIRDPNLIYPGQIFAVPHKE
jgi:nucleoid-associated protein YgaU